MIVSAADFFTWAAGVFGVAPKHLSFETTYASIPEWDSMAQLRLVMETQSHFGVEIPFADATEIRSLWEFFRRINGLSTKKAVAVDLDGTLWNGVVGEDGVDALRPNAAFLAELKALKERGVLLVILSKNNEPDVHAAFDAGALKPLGADDFVARRINWKAKAENLLEIAYELKLGIDAFVFVDDNPAERLKMSMRLPEVAVTSFPPTLAAFFPKNGVVTDEDRRKTEEYREEATRRSFLARMTIPKDALWTTLGCWLNVHAMRPDEAPRVAQLSQKANQFSTCTNRYSVDEIAALGRSTDDTSLFVVKTGDQFGDQGLVAFVIVRNCEIVDFTMSCRVAGRGFEERAWSEIAKALAAKGIRELNAMWKASGKNAPVEDLFDRLGFTCLSVSSDSRRYSYNLAAVPLAR